MALVEIIGQQPLVEVSASEPAEVIITPGSKIQMSVVVSSNNPTSVSITASQGLPGADGAQGAQGPAGPNTVSTSTSTNITGILKGNGTNVEQAIDGTDYNSQNLQSVTDIDNVTTNNIIINDGVYGETGIDIYDGANDSFVQIRGTDGGIQLTNTFTPTENFFYVSGDIDGDASIKLGYFNTDKGALIDNFLITENRNYQLPNSSGTFPLSVNGQTANSSGNITITTGSVTQINTAGLISGGPITGSGTITTSMATNKLVGRSTAGTGVMEEISIGTGLSLSAGTLSSTSVGLASGVTSGTDTYTTTISNVTGYVTNDTYVVKFTNANTGAATININGLGAKTLVKNVSSPLVGGDIAAGQEMIIIYDGTNFQVIGIAPNQMFAFVTNAESTTITKGQVVYAFGAAGDRMSVKLASNTADLTSAKTIGLVYSSSISANGTGYIITQGVIQNLNLGAYNAGDTLYLGVTPGTFTSTKPYAPNHLVYVGIVERANAGNGQIFVRCQNGYELDEIHDVDLVSTAPVNNDVLTYITGSPNLWKPRSVTTILGYIPVPNTRTISTTSPLNGGGDLTVNRTLSIADAAADGTTKGAAAFTASDFNSLSGVISIDYTNGQAASNTNKGFLTSTDWNTFNNKPNGYYQNTTPTGTIPLESIWVHSDTGIEYKYINDGNSNQWVQSTLPLGPQGPQGENGTNTVNSLTATTFTGLLKGNGSTLSATTVGAELGYTAENVANKENVTLDNSSTKYPTNNLVKTNLDSFADDVDYAIMTNQRILFNF